MKSVLCRQLQRFLRILRYEKLDDFGWHFAINCKCSGPVCERGASDRWSCWTWRVPGLGTRRRRWCRCRSFERAPGRAVAAGAPRPRPKWRRSWPSASSAAPPVSSPAPVRRRWTPKRNRPPMNPSPGTSQWVPESHPNIPSPVYSGLEWFTKYIVSTFWAFWMKRKDVIKFAGKNLLHYMQWMAIKIIVRKPVMYLCGVIIASTVEIQLDSIFQT